MCLVCPDVRCAHGVDIQCVQWCPVCPVVSGVPVCPVVSGVSGGVRWCPVCPVVSGVSGKGCNPFLTRYSNFDFVTAGRSRFYCHTKLFRPTTHKKL